MYDPAGNLAFDGEYAYQYDGWNRLVQVNRAAWDPGVPATGGSPATPSGVVLGVLVKRYAFDGLGRLIKTESPRPDPETAGSMTTPPPGEARVEKVYYDGIRRIQEVVEDLSAPATATPSDLDSRQVLARFLSREYVWGPGDGPAGVDELLAQFEGTPPGVTDPAAALAIQSTPWWVLQDAGGDVVGLAETPAPVSGVAQPTAVAAQFVYDAYGAVLSAEHLRAHPFMRVGHKGLFFDRLDVGIVESSGPGAAALPRLVPVANGVYHVRNRACMPRHGRWLQSDPNATGMAVSRLTLLGRCGHPDLAGLDLAGLNTDGAGLYSYLRQNPWRGRDPLGLYDWRDWRRDASEGLDVAWNGIQTVAAAGDMHGLIQGAVEEMINEYALNLELDAEWAGDWSAADDDHSRLDNAWVELALVRGAARHYNLEYWVHFADRDAEGLGQANIVQTVGRGLGWFKRVNHHVVMQFLGRLNKGFMSSITHSMEAWKHDELHRMMGKAFQSAGLPHPNVRTAVWRARLNKDGAAGVNALKATYDATKEFATKYDEPALLNRMEEALEALGYKFW